MGKIIFKKAVCNNNYYNGRYFAIYPKDEEGYIKVIYFDTDTNYYYRNTSGTILDQIYFKDKINEHRLLELIGLYYNPKLVDCNLDESVLEKIGIPEDFEAISEFKIKIKNNSIEFTDEEIKKLILDNPKFACLINQKYTKYGDSTFSSMPKHEGKPVPKDEMPNCYMSNIASKEYAIWLSATFNYRNSKCNSSNNAITMAMRHPDYEDGVVFYMLKHKISVDKDTINHSIALQYKVEHVPGIISKAVKYVRKKPVEVTAFEAFNINSQNITWGGNVCWVTEGNNGWKSFVMENLGYFEKSGFMTLLKYNDNARGNYYSYNLIGSFIVIFAALLVTYPVFELLIKMGYTKMFYDAYETMKQKGSKVEIDQYVKSFDELVDNAATKGKAALRIPPYIGEYLKAKSASINEYFAWRDIYELENLSKENFEKVINSTSFAILNFESGVGQLANILKYGYKVEKLINFVVKKYIENIVGEDRVSLTNYLNTLRDYLHMCDMMQITPDMYPQDLHKVHNDVSVLFRAKEESVNDHVFRRISNEASKYVVPTKEDIENEEVRTSKMWNDYTVIFPDSAKALIEEGNMQHNCVGSYTRNILSGDCIIFFIRKKDEPHKSFITAECRKTGLNQCMYQNNRVVLEKDLRDFASAICNKLLVGVRSENIKALNHLKTR